MEEWMLTGSIPQSIGGMFALKRLEIKIIC